MFRRKPNSTIAQRSSSSRTVRFEPSQPLVPYILSMMSFKDWMALNKSSQAWHALLKPRCDDIRQLDVLNLQLSDLSEPVLDTLDQIFKILERTSSDFQSTVLRSALFYLSHLKAAKVHNILYPPDDIRLYAGEIIREQTDTVLAGNQELVIFNQMLREILTLYTAIKPSTLIDAHYFLLTKAFIAKLRERCVRVKYSFRATAAEAGSIKELESYINNFASKAKAVSQQAGSRITAINVTFYTLIVANGLVALYRVLQSPRDMKTITQQAGMVVAVLLLIFALAKMNYQDRQTAHNRFMLFSAARQPLAAELSALLSEDAQPGAVMRPA